MLDRRCGALTFPNTEREVGYGGGVEVAGTSSMICTQPEVTRKEGRFIWRRRWVMEGMVVVVVVCVCVRGRGGGVMKTTMLVFKDGTTT
jgi:hypothetical protein